MKNFCKIMNGYRSNGFILLVVMLAILIVSLLSITVLQSSLWQHKINFINQAQIIAQNTAQSVFNVLHHELLHKQLDDEHYFVQLFNDEQHDYCVTHTIELLKNDCDTMYFPIKKAIALGFLEINTEAEPLEIENDETVAWYFLQAHGEGLIGDINSPIVKQTNKIEYVVKLPKLLVTKLKDNQVIGDEFINFKPEIRVITWRPVYQN